MIPATTFADKTVAVFGLGLSGVAATKALVAGGARVIAWDDTEKGQEAGRAAGAVIGDLRNADWTAFAALVLAPGVPLTHPEPHWTVELAQRAGVEIVGDTEIFCRERRHAKSAAKIVAITGTNGKSTTTALTHHLLTSLGVDAVLGGNIGEAVLGLPPFSDDRVYVLEFSSFQLDLTPSLDADAAALLNLTPDHLDRHGTMDRYAQVKAKIFEHVRVGGAAAIGADDGYCDLIANAVGIAGKHVVRVSAQAPVQNGIYARASALIQVQDGKVLNTASLDGITSLRGAHNAQNAAAALALVTSLGLSWADAVAGLKTFPGLPHRMEEVRRHGRVLFINDSKATNADATERALASFPNNIYWIVGGKPKAGGIATLAAYFPRVKKAYLIGEAAPAFGKTLGNDVAHVASGTLDAALAQAAYDALRDEEGEAVVLLSPACASYDQFPNFEVRGNVFRDLAQKLEL